MLFARGRNRGRRVLLVAPLAALVFSLGAYADKTPTDSIKDAVVEVIAFVEPPDPAVPWQSLAIAKQGGSGVVIDGHRILTSAHVVAHHVKVTVKRFGATREVDAHVAYMDHESDLALLTLEDETFFQRSKPVELGKLPKVGDHVSVYGFPTGGKSLSLTAGIVSRVEISPFSEPGEEILLAQIDAAINPGNSGGPVIAAGKLVGIAAGALPDAENVGYVVPAPVIAHFIADTADGRVDGVPELGVEWQPVDNESLRESLGLAAGQTGGLVTRLDHGSTADDLLKVGDVVLAIDGTPVDQDLSQELEDVGRVDARYAPSRKQVGESIRLDILRKGEQLTREARLRNVPPLVPGKEDDVRSYCVYGGLVFRPLTGDYIDGFETPPSDLAAYYHDRNVRTSERSQVVMLSSVLPWPVNRGYDSVSDAVVAKINGARPRDIRHAAKLLDSASGPKVTIVTERGNRIVLDVEAVRKATPDILEKYGIEHARSADLAQDGYAMR